jgi:hypothetical protein
LAFEDQDGFSGKTLAFRLVEIQLASQPQNSLELNKQRGFKAYFSGPVFRRSHVVATPRFPCSIPMTVLWRCDIVSFDLQRVDYPNLSFYGFMQNDANWVPIAAAKVQWALAPKAEPGEP